MRERERENGENGMDTVHSQASCCFCSCMLCNYDQQNCILSTESDDEHEHNLDPQGTLFNSFFTITAEMLVFCFGG